MTSHGASGPGPAGGTGRPAGNGAADGPSSAGLTRTLVEAVRGAVEEVGGYAGGVFLRSGTPGLLRLAVLVGLPGPLFKPWWRMHTNRPFPVPEVYRSGRALYLADVEEAMRRFPQLVANLPFPFSSLYAPIVAGRERFGVLAVLRAPSPGVPVPARDRDRMTRRAHALGESLAELARQGTPAVWPGDPVCVRRPAAAEARPVRFGAFDWDLGSGTVTPDAGLLRMFGAETAAPCSIEALTSLLEPEDACALWAAARRATGSDGRSVVRGVRLRGPAGGPLLLDVSPRPPEAPAGAADGEKARAEGGGAHLADGPGNDPADSPGDDPEGSPADGLANSPADGRGDSPADGLGSSPGARLTCTLVDLGTGTPGAEAADRLPRAILAIDRLGLITYANERTVRLLGRSRAALAGRAVWEVLPWFGLPLHEEQLRAALFSDEPVRFLARPGRGRWLSVALYPGRDGVTMVLVPEDDPTAGDEGVGGDEEAGGGGGAAGRSPYDDRITSLYRPVALAIALSEAVTARQVSSVVTEELLPAFGGRQLAIYLLSDRRLHLAWEAGFPPGFLDPFEGVGLDARLPGVETLTTGRPLFFESMERLGRAYPGMPLDARSGARAFLPLIASGRPVGSCILGFERPRGFTPEERTVLTALAGLIAQALERAQRYETESAVARGLQDALLPHRLPVREGVETVGRYLPGTQGMEVGGDWYDVIETGRGRLALVIGDVQGHGVAAAATMGQLRSAVRAFALAGHRPQDVMRGTNRLLIDLDPGQFASCCYVLLDPESGELRAVRAGHPHPLLARPDGTTELVELAGGVLLGIDGRATYPVTRLRLAPGAVLALFTDGLVERPGQDIDVGIEALRRSLSTAGSLPLAEAADRVIRGARQDTARPDDIALLLAARWPERD
ncbi:MULTISPECIES: SpoIIE family protein phosphatase [unclassified Streptomyces]|uniref:SpoIIE family protein phosphatase n=1 Tax=unclassified Streptomyces TaxID=2593676 RepID=UPI00166104D3|nr:MULTISPECIES: SpoIIE family protein phosphatase [unclassified Streptomyces]MBD0708301.1 diguanylate cyclase [Streptomyces sp. CBMA291]MBD0712657.1 diguanylate cyclase [Streptomyces sp. CBMA370]